MKITLPQELQDLTGLIRLHGGNPLLVGGCVVDMLQGREPNDYDIEVYGLAMDKLEEALSPLDPNPVGKAFGILKLPHDKVGGLSVDVSIPRRDNSVGIRHKDFVAQLDPGMTPREAAHRRDFTINTIYFDPVEDRVHDPFGGLADLNDGILRVVDPKTFVEDPLRVLRGMQLLARKLEAVEPGTLLLCRKLVSHHYVLPKERLFGEWRKLLMLADRPSTGLEFLKHSWWIYHYPELKDLILLPQHPDWHPEGDVWDHTLWVVDAAAKVRDRIPEEWREAFMFGMLLHDVGKAGTTDIDGFTAYGHPEAGEEGAAAFMGRLTDDKELTARVVAIVKYHLRPFNNTSSNAKTSGWRRLHNKMRLDILGWVSLCDWSGRPGRDPLDPGEHKPSAACWEAYEKFGNTPEPLPAKLMGRHLIEAGHEPGPNFGPMLAAAYDAQMEDDDLTIAQLLGVAEGVAP